MSGSASQLHYMLTSICPLEVHKNLQTHWAPHDLGNVHPQNEKLHVMVLPHWKTNMPQNLLGVISAHDMTFQLFKWHVSWLSPCLFYHLEDSNVCIIPVSDITLLPNCHFSVIYAHNKHQIVYIVIDETIKFYLTMCHELQLFLWEKLISLVVWLATYLVVPGHPTAEFMLLQIWDPQI
jgi:hypothetical protein